jgi:DNA-binding XRE family transcriptional regulator
MPQPKNRPDIRHTAEHAEHKAVAAAVLRRWRRIRRFNYQALAQLADCSWWTIYFIEHGRHAMSFEIAVKLARALDINVDTFVPSTRVKRVLRKGDQDKADQIPMRSSVVRARAQQIIKDSSKSR